MSDISVRETLTAPVALTGLMLLIGLTTSEIASIDWSTLPSAYIGASLGATAIALLLSIFCWVVLMAYRSVDEPIGYVVARCRTCLPAVLLSSIILPLFLAGFTASKTAIPFIVGYEWDNTFADLDIALFGDDSWRITHFWLGSARNVGWEWIYTVGWGALFLVGSALIAIHASRRRVAVFFTAMFLTWIIGGFAFAYFFSAAGPVFMHLVEPNSGGRFVELRDTLAGSLAPDGLLKTTQGYLTHSLHDHSASKGGGISAMPSMHVGVASIFVLAARRGPLLVPAIAFWIAIFILSAHFGYHYWVDAIPAAAIAWLSWTAADAYYNRAVTAFSAPQLRPA